MTTVDHDSSERPYLLLPTGNIIDSAGPKRSTWTYTDLAIGLSRTYRWGGHSAWKRPLSVAQHSLTVLAIREQDGDLDPSHALYELIHDAEEALIGWDCISPLKQFLGMPFANLCDRLTARIAERYNLPALTFEEHRLHKLADRREAANEALHVVRWSPEQIRATLNIADEPLARDPLIYGIDRGTYVAWEPWTREYAAATWLSRLTLELARAGVPS